jgi:hypothetical protein
MSLKLTTGLDSMNMDPKHRQKHFFAKIVFQKCPLLSVKHITNFQTKVDPSLNHLSLKLTTGLDSMNMDPKQKQKHSFAKIVLNKCPLPSVKRITNF